MNADIVLQFIILSFTAFGMGHWLSQKEWGTPLRTRILMYLAFGLFMIGSFSGFIAFLGIVLVTHQWEWPLYATLLASGSCVYGMTIIQFGAMRGFMEWGDRKRSQAVKPPSQSF